MDFSCSRQPAFFPKADAAVLSCRLPPPPMYPGVVGPVYDAKNADTPLLPLSLANEKTYYPSQKEAYAPAIVPDKQAHVLGRYLRAFLARNERLRLSMLWYYTCDIFNETEFLSGLQEKVCIAQETTGWECAIIGILDVNYYTRLAAVGVPLGTLPRGETLCAHMVAQPPGSVFLLPNMLEDWRFQNSPYVECGGLQAYAGAPLRLQDEAGNTVCLGSLCVASPTSRDPLTRAQQTTLTRMADWIVADLIQLTRARRQRERRRMVDALSAAQEETDKVDSEEPVIQMLRRTYAGAMVNLHSTQADHIELDGRDPVSLSEISGGLWEDTDHIDEFIAKLNHQELPSDRVVRVIAAQCENVSGHSFLIVGSKDFRLVFDDIDAWFVQACAGIISKMWHKRLLAEVMVAKEKFLRGFSHQLRTPIHGILGSAELLAEGLRLRNLDETFIKATALLEATSIARPDEDHRMYLDTIKRAGRDLISIINSMITLNRWTDIAMMDRQYAIYTAHELETELANEMQKVISGDARYNASVIFSHNLPPDNCSFRTDLGLLRDSLLPIIINAIQSTADGLVVVTISARPDLHELIVDVEDTGHGISPKDHQRIFELYEQVDPYSTGAGVGLTLASKFAALLKGSVILVASEIDQGSHFRVTFQNVELTCSESPLRDGELAPQLLNLPQHFHTISSQQSLLSISHHFAEFLTSYDFAASDDIHDALVILDFASDEEQHRAALSEIPSHQVVICLVPFLERGARFHDAPPNVIYIPGPFLTRTMRLALERANKLVPQLRAGHVKTIHTKKDLPLLPKPHKTTSEEGTGNVEPTGILGAASRVAQDPGANQVSLVDANQARTTPESPQTSQHNLVETIRLQEKEVLNDLSWPRTGQLPTPEDSLANLDFDSSGNTLVKSGQVAFVESQSALSVPIFCDPATTAQPTALLVDDNAINLRVMQMYCNKRKLRYLCARDGREAVTLFHEHQESAAAKKKESPIHLILMDLQMPVCDGVEATRRIRQLEREKNWGKSVLFIVTGQDSPADREAAHVAGAHEYHVKPVSMKTLDMGLKRHFPSFEASTRP